MALRDFWIDIAVDGKAHNLASGPRRTGDGMSGTILVKLDGGACNLATIECGTNSHGKKYFRCSIDHRRRDPNLQGEISWEEPDEPQVPQALRPSRRKS